MTEKHIKEHKYTVSGGVLQQILMYLASRNVDTDEFMKSMKMDINILSDSDKRIPVERYVMVEEAAAKVLNDPCFGLNMGQYTEAGNWSILGYMMMNCRTVLDAFYIFSRYSSVIGNLIEGNITVEKDYVMIKLTEPADAPTISKHCYEGYLSSLISLARSISGENIDPIEVALISFRPELIEEYRKVFGHKVRFGQNGNYMSLNTRAVNTQIRFANENLLSYFESYAAEFLNEIKVTNNFTYRTKKLILSYIASDNLTVARIAQELAVSSRTLQANLRKEGTEFNLLLRHTREQLAKKYLYENYSVEDITFLLGFSEPSVFRRAFKKWFGMTVKEYRESEKNKSINA